jgi:ornithine decarboxylase
MSYGNTIKKERDIAHAYRHGIRLYATDSVPDLEKIARAAPGSRVFFRIFCDCKSADWPLSRKFGVDPRSACDLARRARDLGLVPYGLSFHVGSQQRDMTQWNKLIGECAQIFAQLKSEGIELKLMNMGGGLPANYFNSTPDVGEYASSIKAYLAKHFPDGLPEIVMEPGRSLVGDSGIIVAEVVLVSMKDKQWVYLDVGKFGGLIETISESITYPIYSSRQGKAIPVALAGPTCDSADVLYESYILPEGIKEGDRLYIFTTGAYTQSYSAVEFNGFPELKYHFF